MPCCRLYLSILNFTVLTHRQNLYNYVKLFDIAVFPCLLLCNKKDTNHVASEKIIISKESLAGASLPTSLLPIAQSMRRMKTHFSPQRFLSYSIFIINKLFFFVKNILIFNRFFPCSITYMPK